MQLKELSCPNCNSSLTQHNPTSQTIVCQVCGSHVAVGVGGPEKISDGQKIKPPPKPIKLGDRATLRGTEYVVLGRVEYGGWDVSDTSDRWFWTEWLLGSSNGRFYWLSYDDEDGFAVFHKIRIYKPFNPLGDRALPVGKSTHGAPVHERYPARILGAEGELTWRAKPGDNLRMVEGAGHGRLYSVQISDQEIEMYEGIPIEEDQVAAAFGNKKWQRQSKSRRERKVGLATSGVTSLIFALLGLILGVVMTNSGDKILEESVIVNSANPVVVIPVNFDNTRPALVKMEMQGTLPVNTWAELDVAIKDPQNPDQTEDETFVFSQEFWHETGVDEGERWEEDDYSGSGRFVPARAGQHQMEIKLGGRHSGVDQVRVDVEVYKNHIIPYWFYCFGGLAGVGGLGLLAASSPKTTGNIINSLMED